MFKSSASVLSLTVLTLALASCGQRLAMPTPAPGGINGAPTSSIGVVPVFPNSGVRAASTPPANVTSAFSQASPMPAGQPWNVNGAQPLGPQSLGAQTAVRRNGYTVPFFDFYGVSFAYLNVVDRAGDSSPANLISVAASEAATNDDPTTWNVATYVTGANTARDVVASYERGARVLASIFSPGVAPGFDAGQVSQYVMPDGETFWARMTDGRYYDLTARAFVTDPQVQAAKDGYDQLLDTFVQNKAQTSDRRASAWNTAQSMRFMTTGGAGAASADRLGAQWVSSQCGTRSFLWWSWPACDTIASAYKGGLNSWDRFTYSEVQPTRTSDNYYMGCGPWSVARLFQWFSNTQGLGLLQTTGPSTNPVYNTADALVGQMRSYGPLSGGNRATNPWDFINGANAYLSARGSAARMVGTYGQPSLNWQDQMAVYLDAYKVDGNVGKVEEPVIMMHFSTQVQHFGIVQAFNKDHFTDLWAYVVGAPNGPTWFNQSASWSAFSTGAYRLRH